MKIFKIIILFNLILTYNTCYAQDIKMTKEVEEIFFLGKDSIVEFALDKVGRGVSIKNFNQIKVFTDGKEIWVSFVNPIKYLPQETVFYFDVAVGVLQQMVSMSPISNPLDYNEKNISFYKETKETKMNVQFVLQAINKSNETDPIDIINFKDDMIIRAYESYYDISIVSEFQESSFKIEKVSGKIYDTEHNHLEQDPMEDEDKYEFKEINWDNVKK